MQGREGGDTGIDEGWLMKCTWLFRQDCSGPVSTCLADLVDDVLVLVFGDAAVVTGRTHGIGNFAGTPYDVIIRFTDTFVRREGQWTAVASHASVVTSSQPRDRM
jgi:ketosteroid isomerase-like protein